MSERLRDLVGYVPDGAVKRIESVKLKRFRSARAIWDWYLKPIMKEVGETDPEKMLLDGTDGATTVTLQFQEMGLWGCYNPKLNTIFYWVDKSVSTQQAIAFFAHELFHAVQDYPAKWKVEPWLAMERRADLAGLVAAKAYQIVRKLKLK